MRRNKRVELRVPDSDLLLLKECGVKPPLVWEYGMVYVRSNEKKYLEDLEKKYYDLYVHVRTLNENFGKKNEQENQKLDNLLIWYRKASRSITEPTGQDIEALKIQLKKREINSFTVEQVFEYWRINKQEVLSE